MPVRLDERGGVTVRFSKGGLGRVAPAKPVEKGAGWRVVPEGHEDVHEVPGREVVPDLLSEAILGSDTLRLMDTGDAALLAALPIAAANAVTGAIAEAAHTDVSFAVRWQRVAETLRAAFVAVEFPKGLIPVPPDLLSHAQRALVELMAGHSLNPPGGYAVPEPWLLRRWLGLEAPTVLERDVDYLCDGQTQRGPLWLALRKDASNVALVSGLQVPHASLDVSIRVTRTLASSRLVHVATPKPRVCVEPHPTPSQAASSARSRLFTRASPFFTHSVLTRTSP
jgi:hypothetical protein